MNKAVFLDRDGTINREVHYLTISEKLELLPRAAEAIKTLNEAGFKVLVITNQSAVARGLLSATDLEKVHNKLLKLLSEEGAKIDAIYCCPHHPDEDCECRKPKPGLIFRAVEEYDINLSESYMVGDKLIDMETGKNVGCKTVLVLTGYGNEEIKKIRTKNRPDFFAEDLYSAVKEIILH